MASRVEPKRVVTYDLTAGERVAVVKRAKAEHLSVSQWMAKAVREALEAK